MARTWLTDSSSSRSVPFYLMPTLGGGDYLRAFPTYRFRDREAWYTKAEYRFAVHKMADLAGFYEGGKVAAKVDELGFDNMAHSVGVGIRVHSKTANLFRLDAAHGREGWGFRIGFNAGGS
jgi:hemolysin activation/secretion protein